MLEHDIDELIGRRLVAEISFVHFKEDGNCTWIDPLAAIALEGTSVIIILPVLFTILGLKVMEQLINCAGNKSTLLA